jgi:glycosyltransferase involved in cell wall biosynthesis
MGIRLVIVDDNPHLAWDGRVHPANATFQRFAAALLDLPGTPVASITSCVPARDAASLPASPPLDPRIRVVGTAPFDGIEGYLRHLPAMLAANRPILRRAIGAADLVWLKVPASNAGLAALIARRAGTPVCTWVAGSAADVAAARYQGLARVGGRVVGSGYDLIGRLAGVGGHRIVVGAGAVAGDGVVASLVEPEEVRGGEVGAWPPSSAPARLAWAGRLVEGKGLEALVAMASDDPTLALDLIGDGPARGDLVALAASSGAAGRVTLAGQIADRARYLERLGAADAFVFPSPAEGFPKVVLDALAVGLPVLATHAGAVTELVDHDLVEPIERPEPDAIAAAWRHILASDPARIADRRRRGLAFAASHTRSAEAARLVDRWRTWWPALPWQS